MSSKCNNFLPALYRMCNNDQNDHRECITWAEDSRSFWVSNIEQFARDILPIYYKHNNYASFVRQLNLYGFHRSTEPKGKVEPGVQMVEHFTHEHFRRGQEHLLKNIYRKTSKMAGKKARTGKDASAEDPREKEAREFQMAQMKEDIEILKKNQMQLAQTVQGLHQALIALQIKSQDGNEMILKMQADMGYRAVKSEVTPVNGFAQGDNFLFGRRGVEDMQMNVVQQQQQQDGSGGGQSSLVELANDDDDAMGQDMDEMSIQDVLGQFGSHGNQWGMQMQ